MFRGHVHPHLPRILGRERLARFHPADFPGDITHAARLTEFSCQAQNSVSKWSLELLSSASQNIEEAWIAAAYPADRAVALGTLAVRFRDPPVARRTTNWSAAPG